MIFPAGTSMATLSPTFLPSSPLGERTGDEDLAGVVVLFAGTNQRHFFFIVEIQIADEHRCAEDDLAFGQFGRDRRSTRD